MEKKRTVLAATATIFFVCFFVVILNQKNGTQTLSEQEFVTTPPLFSHSDYHFVSNQIDKQISSTDINLKENLWIPAGWTGLPLSIDNPTFIEQSDPEVMKSKKEMIDILETMSEDDWAREEKDQEWVEILRKYETLIGWNGIFDAVDQAETELGIDVSRRIHFLGEVLATSPLVTKNRFIVEITSRDILHKAPMHGGVWVITKDLLDRFEIFGNFSALFETIDEELCFFKNEDNMGNIWISCVHGVGHGIGKYYGVEKIEVALHICSQHPDPQYQYACATGIFMELEKEYPAKTFAPCDSNRFAPACYRFKKRLTSHFFYDVEDPCSTQPTAYHRRACIWGFAYIKHIKNPFAVCEPYRPENPTEQPAANDYAACFDGFLGGHVLNLNETEKTNYCDPLLPFEKAHGICEYYCKYSLRKFTFGSEADDEVYFYNYELLEELFEPSMVGHEAAWLEEWNLS